jgi:glycerate-2-kinase
VTPALQEQKVIRVLQELKVTLAQKVTQVLREQKVITETQGQLARLEQKVITETQGQLARLEQEVQQGQPVRLVQERRGNRGAVDLPEHYP